MTRPALYFDDLHVGDRFRTGSRTLSVDAIKAFAREFDPQPFHLDEEAAQASLFAGLAASGWHVAALTMRMLVDEGPPLAGGMIGGGVQLEWNSPTRPGDALQVESEVVELIPSRSRPDRGIAVLRSVTTNQQGQVVQTQTAKLIVPRRPA